jgi:hypothetical protein
VIPELVNSILGALILKPSLLNGSGLTQDDFPPGRSRETFVNISSMWEGTQPNEIDPVLLGSKLGGDNPNTFVALLTDGALKLESEVFNGRIAELRKEAITRRVLGEIERQAKAGLLCLGEVRRDLEEYDRLAAEADAESIARFTVPGLLPDVIRVIENGRRGEYLGFELRDFPRLTRALNGLREIAVVAAVPKAGKTTLALQIASNVADTGAAVIYYDFENGPFSLLIREFCRKYRVAYWEELFNKDQPWEPILEKLNRFYTDRKNMAIITDRKITIDMIRSQVRELRTISGQDKALIVIDSLQKLPMRLEERRAGVDFWLRGFEELKSQDPNLAIILVSELSRDGLPKESGDIEYMGHFLLRLTADNSDADRGEPIRHLFLEYARDVEAGRAVGTYGCNFSLWEFTES